VNIQPLGEQIIIRTIPPDSVGSVLIPDTAKSITMMGSKPGVKVDAYVVDADLFKGALDVMRGVRRRDLQDLIRRAEKAPTVAPRDNPGDAVHFVEAEIVAVGPGKRQKGDPQLVRDLWDALLCMFAGLEKEVPEVRRHLLEERVETQGRRIRPLVKPGDRILYHPAVQRFDREITHLMFQSTPPEGSEPAEQVYSNGHSGSRYFIIREESVLAVIEP
jgi:co-chaperonin GroES (HSP10)